jgi:hypothetical protein
MWVIAIVESLGVKSVLEFELNFDLKSAKSGGSEDELVRLNI